MRNWFGLLLILPIILLANILEVSELNRNIILLGFSWPYIISIPEVYENSRIRRNRFSFVSVAIGLESRLLEIEFLKKFNIYHSLKKHLFPLCLSALLTIVAGGGYFIFSLIGAGIYEGQKRIKKNLS